LPKAIGLDFGTTNSALAIVQPNRSVKLARFNGHATFRSILYFEAGEFRVKNMAAVTAGPAAIDRYLNAESPGRLIQSAKSYLASRLFNKTQIFGATYTLEELIGIILKELRQTAEAEFGDLGSSLVVGRPVHFSGATADAEDAFALTRLRVALRKAGFDNVHFIPEPVAAAYKYQLTLDHEELVLIADFGGGTSDFSLVQLKPSGRNQTESAVIGSDGVGIAGDTFDSKLVRHLVAPMLGMGSEYRTPFGKVLPMPLWVYENLQRWHYLSFLKTRKQMRTLNQLKFHALEPQKIAALIELVDHDLGYRLYQAIEGTKCNLSSAPSSAFVFKELSTRFDESVTRAQFENWIEPEVRDIDRCIDRLLARCNVKSSDVGAVFMTGGSSFVPAIRRIFEQKFGDDTPIKAGDEFTSVAIGLAIKAAEIFRT
jgi:hypothetical chaperone protein